MGKAKPPTDPEAQRRDDVLSVLHSVGLKFDRYGCKEATDEVCESMQAELNEMKEAFEQSKPYTSLQTKLKERKAKLKRDENALYKRSQQIIRRYRAQGMTEKVQTDFLKLIDDAEKAGF